MTLVLLLVLVSCGEAVSPTTAEPATVQDTIECEGLAPATSGASEEPLAPNLAAELSIAGLLEEHSTLTRMRELAETATSPALGMSWLEIWDMPGARMGDNRDGVTVFAPTDDAFDRLDPELWDALINPSTDNELRYELIGHHYVHRLYPSSQFEPGSQRTWRGGGKVELTLEPLSWGGCPILSTDIKVENGYVHLLGGVVMPSDVHAALAG